MYIYLNSQGKINMTYLEELYLTAPFSYRYKRYHIKHATNNPSLFCHPIKHDQKTLLTDMTQ